MPKKKNTRPSNADQDSGAADPSLVSGSAESNIDKDLDDLTSELSSKTPPASSSPEPEPTPKASPQPKAKPQPEPQPKPQPKPAPTQAPDPEPADDTSPPKGPKLSPIEFGALGLIALIVLGFLAFLFTIPDDDLPTSDEIVRPADSVPESASGDLITLTSIDAYWRPLADTDRTDKTSDLLPELSLKVSQKNTSAPSFLKIYFIDPKGEISGDVRTARIEGGKLVDTGRGETVTGPDGFSVYCSKGIKDKSAFLAYRYSGEDSWSIQVFEGADYSNGPWNSLALFEIPDLIKGDAPAE